MRCKNRFENNRFQTYEAQQKRGRRRKLELIGLRGNRCEKCGYGKNYSALEFHHADPLTKMFSLDLRSLSNRKWTSILEEAEKCELLCSNCHKETLNPGCKIP